MRKNIPIGAFLVPDKAEKVFDGPIFDVYQWDQEMFDGSNAIFEMLKRADTVQILAIKDYEIVVVVDEQPGLPPNLTLPGGRAESEDGDWLTAAKRELQEETGMTFKSWKLICAVQPAPKIEWFCPFFVATDFDGQSSQNFDSDGEKIEVKEMTFEELKERALSGHQPKLSYLSQVIGKYSSLDELLHAPEFEGKEVNR